MDTDWSALRPDPRNARKHTSRNRQLLSASLAEVGAARSIVIDEDGTILAGNATAEAARKKGLRLQIIDTEGDTLIAVRRSGLTEMQKTRLALYDNRSAEMAEWNLDVLQALTHDDWTGILEPVDLKGLGADISIWDIPADQLPESLNLNLSLSLSLSECSPSSRWRSCYPGPSIRSGRPRRRKDHAHPTKTFCSLY